MNFVLGIAIGGFIVNTAYIIAILKGVYIHVNDIKR